MYIESLEVENFRCFEKARVLFEYHGRHIPRGAPRLPNVNLILGDNGTGKSAILTAIALSVLGRVIQSSGFRPYLLVRRTGQDRSDSSDQQESAAIRTKLRLHLQDMDKPRAVWEPETIGSISSLALVTRRADTETISLAGQHASGKWNPLLKDASPAFFLAAYGASRRVASGEAFDQSAREKARAPRYQRVAGLFEEAITLIPVSIWAFEFRQKERLDEGLALLNALLPMPVRVTAEPLNMDGALITPLEVVFRVRGTSLPFPALSDGYRGFVGWVVDLLYQMSQVTPSEHKLTDLCGVVIVDELDLLLHPAWQRTVIETIATTFPRLQFFFTSHSPIIAGTLEAANLIVTEVDEETGQIKIDKSREQVYGLSADQVLSSRYFGLASSRAPGLERQLQELAERALENPDAAKEYLRLLARGDDGTADAAPRNGERQAR